VYRRLGKKPGRTEKFREMFPRKCEADRLPVAWRVGSSVIEMCSTCK
jgi:hypothetical protein